MNYSNLMDAVNARIRANGRREITGDILNDVLRAMVVELGAGYQLGGTIRPGDKPKDEDLRVAYLAVEPGMYLYAGGFEVTELSLITYGAEWYMYPLGVPFGSQIAEDIAAAVEAEKTRAMAAEKVLSDTIATERSERAAADSALDSAIKAETKRATDAEGVLTKAVEDEKTRAMAAEGANASAITAEADARAKADTALQRNISAEETAREAADDALAAKVTAEEAARKAADATLQANINTEESERKAADTALGTRVTNIEDKIPAQATSENKLADKDFVNSSIATSTATFRGTFDTLEALKAAQADKNDYAFWVHKDEDGNTCYDKYTYDGTEWKFEYRLNNSSFTAAQWAALNSGVTADIIKALQDSDKANAKAIADEKAERIAAIIAEATNREDADDALEEKITAETTERKAADATLQGNIDKKQDIISDLATIRANAANGQTAFGWGDHAKAGYVKPFVIAITGDGSAENPYAIDKTFEEIVAARSANSLILLNDGSYLYVASPFDINPDGISITFAVTWADDGALWAYYIDANPQEMDITIYNFGYIQSGSLATINGKSVENGGDIKVGVPTIQAGTGMRAEVFNDLDPAHAYGDYSHAEGEEVQANGGDSHAEGYASTANGNASHAEGDNTTANGFASHAEGGNTIAEYQYSHAEGLYNIQDAAAIHSVGIGTASSRKDAHRITYDGKHYIIGIGGFDGTKATANLTNEKDLATVINEYETRIAALETALAGIKSN